MAADVGRVRRAVRADLPLEKPVAWPARRLGIRTGPICGRPELDRDRLHLSGGDAGVARLGRRCAALLYLALYPALATGLAWKFGRDNRLALLLVLTGAWTVTEWLRGTMFTGFPWNPAAAVLVPTPLIGISPLIGTYALSGIVILLGGAIWLEIYRRWLPLVVILAVTALLWLLPSSPVPPDPLTVRNVRIVQPNIGQQDKWRPGLRRGGRAPSRAAVGPARPASRGCCCGPKPRSPTRSTTRAPMSTRRWPSSNAPAPAPCSAPTTGC